MDEMNNSPENVETLQQMSEDMKLHIAQLKAELGSSDFDGIRSYGSLPVSMVDLMYYCID